MSEVTNSLQTNIYYINLCFINLPSLYLTYCISKKCLEEHCWLSFTQFRKLESALAPLVTVEERDASHCFKKWKLRSL